MSDEKLIYSSVFVGELLRTLNSKCVSALNENRYSEAERFAAIARNVIEAMKVSGLDKNDD